MLPSNPLITGIQTVQEHVAQLRDHARKFYLRVVLEAHACPHCTGRLESAGPSVCRCASCGHELDPTTTFQKSPCCAAKLRKCKCHYACTKCGATVPSRFLYDERIFDQEYFALRMRESRERRRSRREELRKLLANTRSDALHLTDVPSLDSIEGLVPALDAFIGTPPALAMADFLPRDEFRLDQYRTLILETIENACTRFTAIPKLCQEPRTDRVRRFITLIFMHHAQEIDLVQYENDLLVSKK